VVELNTTTIPSSPAATTAAIPSKLSSKEIVEGVKAQLLEKYKDEAQVELLMATWGTLITEMAAARDPKDITKAIIDLEDGVKKAYEKHFRMYGLDIFTVRKELIKIVNNRIKKGKLDWREWTTGKTFFSTFKLGWRDLRAIVNGNRGNASAYQKWLLIDPVEYKPVTWQFFDAWVGNHDKSYNAEDDAVQFDVLVNKLEKVGIFVQVSSPERFTTMLDMLSCKKFIMVGDSDVSEPIKSTLKELVRENINNMERPRLSHKDGESETEREEVKTGNERLAEINKRKDALIKNADRYIDEGKLEYLFGKNKDLGDEFAEGFNYLEKYKDTSFYRYLGGTIEAKDMDINTKYTIAGLAALWGDSDSFKSHLKASGGKEKDLFNVNVANKKVAKVLMTEACRYAAFGYTGVTKYGPDNKPFKIYVKEFLKDEKAVEKEADEVDNKGKISMPGSSASVTDSTAPAASQAPANPPPAPAANTPKPGAKPVTSAADRAKNISSGMKGLQIAVINKDFSAAATRLNGLVFLEVSYLSEKPPMSMKSLASSQVIQWLNGLNQEMTAKLLNELIRNNPKGARIAGDILYALKVVDPNKAGKVLELIDPKKSKVVKTEMAAQENNDKAA